MAKNMTDEEWENIQENIDASEILDCVKKVDELRQLLGDDENFRPPEIRDDLLRLHRIGMDLVNMGYASKSEDFFELAFDISMELDEIMERVEHIQATLHKITDCAPEQ